MENLFVLNLSNNRSPNRSPNYVVATEGKLYKVKVLLLRNCAMSTGTIIVTHFHIYLSDNCMLKLDQLSLVMCMVPFDIIRNSKSDIFHVYQSYNSL